MSLENLYWLIAFGSLCGIFWVLVLYFEKKKGKPDEHETHWK